MVQKFVAKQMQEWDNKTVKNKGEKNMRKTYVEPEMEVVPFGKTDVMLSSGNKGYQSDPFEQNPFEGAAYE